MSLASIPRDVYHHILGFLDYTDPLRSVSRDVRAGTPRPPGRTKDALLVLLARAGEGDLMSWALANNNDQIEACHAERILTVAAAQGNLTLCRRARRRGATDVTTMIRMGAMNGDEKICRLAYAWGGGDIPMMLAISAYAGSVNCCALARSWCTSAGVPILPEKVLISAVFGGHEHICRMARAWGANDFNRMLFIAAQYGRERLCCLAREWGATDYESMLAAGAQGGAVSICEQNGVALGRHDSICRLARAWLVDVKTEAPQSMGNQL